MPEDFVDEIINKRDSIVISDDYALMDSLIASMFEEQFYYNRNQA